jgi:predicted ATPase
MRNSERGFIAEWENSISIDYRNSLLKVLRDCVNEVQQNAQNNKQMDLFRQRYANITQQFEKDLSLKNYFQITDGFPPPMRHLLTAQLEKNANGLREAIKAGREQQFVLAYAPVPSMLEFATDYVRNYFTSNLKYLGPLRDEPKSIYPLSGTTDSRDVGFKGEHTAAVLDVYKNTPIAYIPSDAFKSAGLNTQPSHASLVTAVSDWLSYMGVVHDLETTDKGKHGHELRVSTTGSDALHDLTHVGVGVSQVLPILVLSLLAQPDSTLVFEQPELHLHPRVQTRLADFFIAMSMLGKQCIVETHSEYLINRLRYLSAISKGKDISDRVILYFVEKDGGHSRYKPIRINEFGVIPDWPKGFFDENEENAAALLRAAMEKRKRKNQKKDAPPLS